MESLANLLPHKLYLCQVIPDNASKIAEFQEVIKCTAEFEASLKKIGFISRDDNEGEKLSLFASDIEVHFATQKKKEILASARNILLECDFIFTSVSFSTLEHFSNIFL